MVLETFSARQHRDYFNLSKKADNCILNFANKFDAWDCILNWKLGAIRYKASIFASSLIISIIYIFCTLKLTTNNVFLSMILFTLFLSYVQLCIHTYYEMSLHCTLIKIWIVIIKKLFSIINISVYMYRLFINLYC